ncbi:hypothetical protein KSS87_021934 [Heliosperma pusillum]|nr:hypothetical protein KSS87_000218 [Heliosperma pusillum]KAH9609465.1 hypothetical protein KSS87_021934 [Heliosperma pusillum]
MYISFGLQLLALLHIGMRVQGCKPYPLFTTQNPDLVYLLSTLNVMLNDLLQM